MIGSKSRRLLFFLVLSALFLFGVTAGVVWLRKRGEVPQPIAFNHRLHVTKVGLECNHCHTGVESGPFATLPKAEICLECHAEPISESPEEEKVRAFGKDGKIPWVRLTRLQDHVYFSHRRHVKFGEVSCQKCHGKMEERTRPPSRAPVELSMDDCLECHRSKGVSSDCVHCHR